MNIFNKHLEYWSFLCETQLNEGKHWPEDYKKTAINTIKNSALGQASWYTDDFIEQDVDTIVSEFEPLSHKNSNLGFFATIIRWFVEYAGSNKDRYQEFIERKLDNIIQGLLKLTAMPAMMEKSQEIKAWTLDQFESWKSSEDKKSDSQTIDSDFQETNEYDVVPCYTYKELNSKFGGDKTGYKGKSKWCHTNGKSTYDSWTEHGTKLFFVLAKKGWEQIKPPSPESTNAYDEYGLSLIAILVDVPSKKLLNATLRWNHIIEPSKTKPGATVDKAFDNFVELSKAIGTNVQEKIDPFLAKIKERFLNDKNNINIGGKYFRIIKNAIDCSNKQLTSLNGAPSEVGGYFKCFNNQLTSLEGCPSKVGGKFDCSYNDLTSLKGAPSNVGGDFDCSYNNKLTSLEGCPSKVGGNFDCSNNNKLTSLEYAPSEVEGDFYCSDNKLISLKGAPYKVGGYFDCSYNNELTSLEGAPSEVRGYFYCFNNKLTSLEGAPSKIGRGFNCSYNKLISLKGCPSEIEEHFNCSYNKLTSLEYAPSKVGGNFRCSDNNLTSLKGAPSKVGGDFYCSDNQLTDEQVSAYKTFLKMTTEQQKASGLLDDTGHYDPKE